ncbi:monooxygenase FAD-binding [Methylobacterium sp. 4-46]|uniref:FAD binding domain-containing protein n=1 Tax=unclassified Methylobacterium TaxID=2615210 RepID=UPI000165C5B5|nr:MULTISPECIES: FAD binding domain-containing protein [Methylobacterium]ACA18275.1 monooxygenase FAD-binding [Methylobacterium sp. 4-46]WFT77574.1 FAD binding domain-containing protein [Methylobacterium nodulans]
MAIRTGSAGRRAIIVGGSLGGLFAALLLRRVGWQAEIYERVGAELSGRGAGIVTHAELFDALERAGIERGRAEIGVAVAGRRVLARDGSILAERALPQVLTAWGHLYTLLRRALPDSCYHRARGLVRVEEGPEAVTAHFADGSTARGDLLIGADGIGSAVRAQFAPEAAPLYAGYVAWRGLVEEADLSGETRAALCDHFCFALPHGEQILGYPVAGAGDATVPGRRRFNFVWYRPAAPETGLRTLLTDLDGVTHPLSIPPNRIRPEVTAAMRRDARRLLAPAFAEVVERTAQPFLQAIQDLETPRMVLGRRAVILGDAAFVARPHVGMGVTKAAGDARALAEALDAHPHDLAAALGQFERARLAPSRAVVRRARELGAFMQAQLLTPRERALAERHRAPEAVMAETAVATGLAA